MQSHMHIRPRFALGILLGTILLICARIVIDYPTGRNKVESLFPDQELRESNHAIHRAIGIDERTWDRAETLTNQALILGLLGVVASLVALRYAGQSSNKSGQHSRETGKADEQTQTEQAGASDGDKPLC